MYQPHPYSQLYPYPVMGNFDGVIGISEKQIKSEKINYNGTKTFYTQRHPRLFSS